MAGQLSPRRVAEVGSYLSHATVMVLIVYPNSNPLQQWLIPLSFYARPQPHRRSRGHRVRASKVLAPVRGAFLKPVYKLEALDSLRRRWKRPIKIS
jgi:hypothetical protein